MPKAKSAVNTQPPVFQSLVLRQMPVLFHVGHLQGRERSEKLPSFEGLCLSVSEQPAAWRRIARLGDAPTWRLERDGALFADVYASLRKATLAEELQAWGVAQGLVTEVSQWEAWWEDAEEGVWKYTLHETEEEARDNLDEPDERDHLGRPVVRPRAGLLNTALLRQRTGCPERFPHALQFVLMAALLELNQSQAPGHKVVEGLFWNDELDVSAHSAPRAGIFEDRLPLWERRVVTPS